MTVTTPTVVTTGPQVVSPDAANLWRRWRWPLAVLAVILISALVLVVGRGPTSQTPLAPDNPNDGGAMAVAEILRDQGVRITYVNSSADGIAAAGPGTTLLLTRSDLLTRERLDGIAETGADLVLAEPTNDALAALAPGVTVETWSAETSLAPGCADPDANAAGGILVDGAFYTGPGVVACYRQDDAGWWATLTVDGHRVDLLGGTAPMTNESLTEAGNAALVLRTLGRNEHLVWVVPTWDAETAEVRPDPAVMLPPWLYGLGLTALAVGAAAALWRSRRLGRLVPEPLPVTVKAVETTLGRARLYRRAGAHAHAAAALRAGTVTRLAHRLGLPASAGRAEVVDALVAATGRNLADIDHLLYGAPPTNDTALLDLTAGLDALEKEVRA